jgi:hypothetical protein
MTFNPSFPCGRRYRHTLGYILVHCPGHPNAQAHGYIPEHRLVMERAIGRPLGKGEKVAHKNRDKTDNRLENLILVTPPTLAERFWAKVAKGDPDACWEWTGRRHKQGYGIFWIGTKPLLGHRVAFALANGPVPAGQCVCHRCDNPPCVNPAHLFLGTQQENMRDMSRKRRGHALTADQVAEVRALREGGLTVREVAARFGVSAATVTRDVRLGRAKGERNAKARLTADEVQAIRAFRRAGMPTTFLSRIYGVTKGAVSSIARRKSWRHLPDEVRDPSVFPYDPADIAAALAADVKPLFG